MNVIKELYAYREMIYSLVRKELRGRYKGSVLVFSVIMRNGIERFYLYLFVALVPWIFFSSSLTGGSGSVMASQDMVKKICFPREVLK